MQKEIEITLLPEDLDAETVIKNKLSNALKIDVLRIKGYKILKRSIDARSRNVTF